MKNYIYIFLLLVLVSCETAVTGFDPNADQDEQGGGGSNPINSIEQTLQNAIANAVDSPPVVEIRHLVEPVVDDETVGGAYLKKLTIPKNYKGKLYLAGINLSTLSGQNIKVRFKLGVDRNPIEIPADVAFAPGLVDGTSVSVLVMDLRNIPFSNLRLPYDLYDYNDYTFDGSSSANALTDAVSYNRNTQLYCRGLRLEDDPTYSGSVADQCDQDQDICKYAYVKVVDQGLTYENEDGLRVFEVPNRAQIQSSGSSYYTDIDEEKLSRCLPDDPVTQNLATGVFYIYDNLTTFANFTQNLINGILYRYEGPYRLEDTSNWQMTPSSNASINKNGIFRSGITFNYYKSLMFPRYVKAKSDLSAGVQYLGSDDPDGAKILQTINVSGESKWMDGCNERAVTRDPATAEHVGSCQVTGEIEVFQVTRDSNGQEIESAIAISKDVKLQIVKEANEPQDDTDIFAESFRACTGTSQCGTSECCINNRCWDKSIVSSCIEDEPTYGNEVTGSFCSSDYECASLCCQGGKCQPHDENGTPPILCSKQVGQSCVAKSWCAQQPVTRCFIVKTGVDAQGGQQCALRCYTNPESGECINGSCAAPIQPIQPIFDETDPNRCANACDPPDFSNGVFSINCGGN